MKSDLLLNRSIVLIACVALLLLPAIAQAQTPEERRGQLRDSVTVGGLTLQLFVAQGNALADISSESLRDSTLRAAGYQLHGEFYYSDWPDPIWTTRSQITLSFAEPASDLNLPEAALSPGGQLQIKCQPRGRDLDPFGIAVTGDAVLIGENQNDIRGVAAVDGSVIGPSDDWTLTLDHTGAFVPERHESRVWSQLTKGDTLAVRLRGALGTELTYVFLLNGLDSLVPQYQWCAP